jgi:hypothetical protein
VRAAIWSLIWSLLAVFAACGQDLGVRLKSAAGAEGVVYVGYQVPLVRGAGTVCGLWGDGVQGRRNKLMLDGPRKLTVLVRFEKGVAGKLLLASEDCQVEAGGQRVQMLDGVTAAMSVRYLAAREDDGSMYALALHDDAEAATTLIGFARDRTNPKRQQKAFYWLARSEDPQAESFIRNVLR